MRTVTNYYLLNLSVADLLMSSMNCVFNFIFLLNNDWPFGALYCTVNNFIANLSVASSVFTLVAISMDRYIAIVKPLRHRSRNKGKLIMVCIWLLSALLAFPCLLYSKTRINRWVCSFLPSVLPPLAHFESGCYSTHQSSPSSYSNGRTRTLCYMLWPDGRHPTSKADYMWVYQHPARQRLLRHRPQSLDLWTFQFPPHFVFQLFFFDGIFSGFSVSYRPTFSLKSFLFI